MVAIPNALAIDCANRVNCAPNWATDSADPSVLRRRSARALAWLSRAYRPDSASTTCVRRVASSTFSEAISSDSMSRSADIACMPAMCSPSCFAVVALAAASSSFARRSSNGASALAEDRNAPVAAPTASCAADSDCAIASIAVVSM